MINSDPLNARLLSISSILISKYNPTDLGNKHDPVEELIFILLTIKTDHKKYDDLWDRFRYRFTNFEEILSTEVSDIAKTISIGGLQVQKANRIKSVLIAIKENVGTLNLKFLEYMSDKDCERFLLTLPGVGKKVARCVLMYSLHRNVLPVDSNILRICKRLGVTNDLTESEFIDRLQDIVHPKLRYSMHITFVLLGREICTQRRPKCNVCPIAQHCNSRGKL